MQNGKSIEQLENVFLSPQYMKRSNTKIADSAKTKKKFKIYHIKKERNEFAPSLVNLSVICLYFGSNGQDTSVWCTIFFVSIKLWNPLFTRCARFFAVVKHTDTLDGTSETNWREKLSLSLDKIFVCMWAYGVLSLLLIFKNIFPSAWDDSFFLHRNNCIMFDVSHTYKSLSLLCWD